MDNSRHTIIGRLALPVLVTFLLVCAQSATAQPTEEEIMAAIDAGVSWLVNNQHPEGWWDSSGYSVIGETGLACTKLMDYATDSERGLGLPSPFDDSYIYRDNVIACVDWLLNQANGVAIAPQAAGDPDTNGNGIGIRTQNFWMYESAIALMALCNTVDLGRTAPATSPQAGRTYLDIAQDMADYLYFCQGESGAARGAWDYGCNPSARADQSVSGWVGFGFGFSSAPPPEGCGLDIPQFVLDELALYAAANQDPANGCANYSLYGDVVDPRHNFLKQGHLLQILALTGNDSSSAAVEDAVSCMCSFYDNPSQDPGWTDGAGSVSYQATYTAVKGLLAFGDDLEYICDPQKDWRADFDAEIVYAQNADGSWGDCHWGDAILCTSWALLTLERAVPPAPNTPPLCDANGPYVAECAGATTSLALDGTGSSDPDGDWLSFSWTTNCPNGVFDDANSGTPILSTDSVPPFPLNCTVDLTVDDGELSDSCDSAVTVDDTIAPVISCNNPPTIVPPDAPISFTASAEDQCEASISAQITAYDCFMFTSNGRRIDKTQSCVVSIDGDTISVLDSGGVGDNIEWTVEATDSSGNTTTEVCSLVVERPVSSD